MTQACDNPNQTSADIGYVIVNGIPAVEDGQLMTAARPGEPIRNAMTNVMPPLGATIGQSEAAETVVYVGVDDINAALEKVTANGGTIRYPRFEVPGRVILGIFKDPTGNSVELVEMENGAAKVPPMPAASAAPGVPAAPAGANP